MAHVGKIKVPVEIYSCERDRWQALNALLSEQLAERAARAHRSLAGVSAEAAPDEPCLCGEVRDDDCGHPDCPIAHPVDTPPPSDSTWPWPIAPDTVMPPRRQPVRWGSRADDPPTEIHDDPQRTKAYLAGLATGRAESRDRTEALRQIVDLPVVDDSDADRMREIADAALAGVSAEATPERGGVGAIDDGPVGQERSGESVVAPPQNPYARQPYRGAGRPEAVAWNDGYAAGVAAGQSLPSTGTGWDRGYAAGVSAEATPDEPCLCGEVRDDDCGHPDCPIARPPVVAPSPNPYRESSSSERTFRTDEFRAVAARSWDEGYAAGLAARDTPDGERHE